MEGSRELLGAERERVGGSLDDPAVGEPSPDLEERPPHEADRPHEREGDVVVPVAVAVAGVGEQLVEAISLGLGDARTDGGRIRRCDGGRSLGAPDGLQQHIGHLDEGEAARRVLRDHPPGVVGEVVVERHGGLRTGGANDIEARGLDARLSARDGDLREDCDRAS